MLPQCHTPRSSATARVAASCAGVHGSGTVRLAASSVIDQLAGDLLGRATRRAVGEHHRPRPPDPVDEQRGLEPGHRPGVPEEEPGPPRASSRNPSPCAEASAADGADCGVYISSSVSSGSTSGCPSMRKSAYVARSVTVLHT